MVVQCEKCCACSGLSAKTKKNPTIVLHGDAESIGPWRYNRYMAVMKKRKAKKAWRRDYASERKVFKKVCKF